MTLAHQSALDVLRDQIAPGASDEELAYFGEVCRRTELDPFANHIVLIGRRDGRVGRVVFRPQITVAGRRTLAARTGELVGNPGPEWAAPGPNGHAERDEHGAIVWRELWDDDNTYPYAARCLVYRRGYERPANGTVKWSEFAQWARPAQGPPRLERAWAQMPSHMLGKVAESLALRRAFPEISAITLAGDEEAGAIAEASAEPAERVPPEVYDAEADAGADDLGRPY